METMGMTDKQFNGFLRLVIKDLKQATEAEDKKTMEMAIEEVIKSLQETLED